MSIDDEGRAEGGQQFVSDQTTVFAFLQAEKGNHKFVTAKARQNVFVSQYGTKALPDLT